MKVPSRINWLLLFSVGLPTLFAQEAPTKWDVVIPEPIVESRPQQHVVTPAPIRFKVISSRTRKVDVLTAAEMLELPPITGRINFTVQRVEDPGIPDPPIPPPAPRPEDPEVSASMAVFQEQYQGTSLVFISATVYDRNRTLLRISRDRPSLNEVTAWSNLDFNHFCNLCTYRVRDGIDGTFHDYGILMGIGNENTARLSGLSSRSGWRYDNPEIPELPDLGDGGPAFVVLEGDAESSAMATLEQLHDLYRKEGKHMEADSHARKQAYEEKKARLLANPTKPKDVTIRVWNRSRHR